MVKEICQRRKQNRFTFSIYIGPKLPAISRFAPNISLSRLFLQSAEPITCKAFKSDRPDSHNGNHRTIHEQPLTVHHKDAT
jgi:hypothetical protein